MSDELQLAFTVMGIGIALVAIYELFLCRKARLRWKIRLTRSMRIADANNSDWAKLVGVIRCRPQSLEAPIARTTCVFYETTLDIKWSAGGKGGYGSQRLIHERAGCDFIADDGSGTALVELDEQSLDAIVENNLRQSASVVTDEFPTDAAEFLLSRGFDLSAIGGRSSILCERFLAEGRRVAVLGEVHVDRSGGPRTEKKPEVVIHAPFGKKLIIKALK